MKVTQVKPLTSRPGMFRIYVDESDIGVVTADDVLELGLIPGQAINEQIYGQLNERVGLASFMSLAVGYADRRLRSKLEVRRFLKSKQCPDAVAEVIIDKLTQNGVIDEAKLAAAYVHDAKLGKPMSKKTLELKLRQKAIDEQLIREVIASDDRTDVQALDELILRKSKQSSYANNQPRFFRYLLSQGFSFEDIAARIGKPETSNRGGRSGYRTSL